MRLLSFARRRWQIQGVCVKYNCGCFFGTPCETMALFMWHKVVQTMAATRVSASDARRPPPTLLLSRALTLYDFYNSTDWQFCTPRNEFDLRTIQNSCNTYLLKQRTCLFVYYKICQKLSVELWKSNIALGRCRKASLSRRKNQLMTFVSYTRLEIFSASHFLIQSSVAMAVCNVYVV